ncbi:antitoxin AF2212-like protein [Geoglobus acetivorans]|uniref:Antitoxin n=1 Tax=Geoglobus acetivorans TaxID=565033 RepID=A0ABZ3H450_GEOAI|nr:antitoxin family protein [Geoglobus acetivorans]
MGIKAKYEKGVLKPLEELNLKEGEEVEIEIRRKKADILKYAGILKDLSREEIGMFMEAAKRRSLFKEARL